MLTVSRINFLSTFFFKLQHHFFTVFSFQPQSGWFAHPIYSQEGDYPKLLRTIVDENSRKEKRTRSRLPIFTNEEINLIRGNL